MKTPYPGETVEVQLFVIKDNDEQHDNFLIKDPKLDLLFLEYGQFQKI